MTMKIKGYTIDIISLAFMIGSLPAIIFGLYIDDAITIFFWLAALWLNVNNIVTGKDDN